MNDFSRDRSATDFAEVDTLHRRDFFKLVGGGITIFFAVGKPLAWPQAGRRGSEYPEDPNAYLRIGEDGRVSCFTGKIEMGQGIVTSLSQMLAEELDVSVESVDMVMGDTALCPYDSATVGSRSTKYFGPPLRRAAAEARAVLFQLAAESLGVPVERLAASGGVIRDTHGLNKEVTYAQLAGGKRIERRLGGEAALKHYSRHTVSGRPMRRTDSRKKVTGEALFAGDVRLPAMLYARILRPPSHGAKLTALDVSGVERYQGARVVRDGDLIAVLHRNPDEAETALAAVRATYEEQQSDLSNQTIFEHLASTQTPGDIVTEKGDVAEGRRGAALSVEAAYHNHYVAHAAIETHTAVAEVGEDGARLWVSTQAPFRVRDSVARILGLPSDRVRVITPFVGGGFGGKTWIQQAEEAARLAKLVQSPVQVAWSRREEFFYDTFRPAAVIKAKAGLDRQGGIVYWDFEILFAGTRSSEPVYDIPHYRVSSRGASRGEGPHPFNVGAWRGPGSNTNVFAMESHTDLMAHAAGMDPLSFRLKNLTDPRMRRVLETAADKFDRSFAKGPSGKGYGIACTNYLGTCLAAMAEVEVDERAGMVRVERVVCAEDMGEVINPAGATLQMEGCITMGLGYVLAEEVRFRGGKILDENFDTYQIARFSWVPKIETVLIDNPEMAPQGCGEPTITCMGAVIANAVYDAVGARLFVLPMTPERIRLALRNGR